MITNLGLVINCMRAVFWQKRPEWRHPKKTYSRFLLDLGLQSTAVLALEIILINMARHARSGIPTTIIAFFAFLIGCKLVIVGYIITRRNRDSSTP